MSVSFAVDEYPVISVPDKATESLASFRDWAGNNELPDKARVCFFRGEVYVEMGKEDLYTHVDVKTDITAVLRTIAKREKLGSFWGDGVLLTHEDAELSCNPDAVLVSNDALTSARATLIEGKRRGYVEVVGTPDMVLEVVSDSSVKKDKRTLLEAYFTAGIPEYWLVDARGEEVEFTIYRRSEKKYIASRAQPGGWLKSSAFGMSFRLILGTNKAGKPEYTLEVK